MIKSMQDAFLSGLPLAQRESRSLLEKLGLRATRQRLGLARLLFSRGDRHVTANSLAAEANAARMSASPATVYNVLSLFAQVGLVREVAIEGTKRIFDTNTSDHSHFLVEETGEIMDIAVPGSKFADAFEMLDGFEIARVNVVVRLRRKNIAGAWAFVLGWFGRASPAADCPGHQLSQKL